MTRILMLETKEKYRILILIGYGGVQVYARVVQGRVADGSEAKRCAVNGSTQIHCFKWGKLFWVDITPLLMMNYAIVVRAL